MNYCNLRLNVFLIFLTILIPTSIVNAQSVATNATCVATKVCDTDFDGDKIPDLTEMLYGGVPSSHDNSGKYIIDILYNENFGVAPSATSESICLGSLNNGASTSYNYYVSSETSKVTDYNAPSAANSCGGTWVYRSLQDGFYTIHHKTHNISSWTQQNGGSCTSSN